ncbi:hypothetical protein BDZ91DRAFT_736977 [Kalaharituber pfeilii]|nr:hypothetical protein BDZ91DRAFT_736977 [Kalaharituber pfeilii]
MHQKGRYRTDNDGNGESSTICRYCKDVKGWRGLGHTEYECFTKKREERKQTKKAPKVESAYEDAESFVRIPHFTVLTTEEETCRYCRDVKGWTGIGHTENECLTKKRDEKKKTKNATKVETEEVGAESFVGIPHFTLLTEQEETCRYCINVKGWTGIGHTEGECLTKKKDENRKSKNEVLIPHLTVLTATDRSEETVGWFRYDATASVHTTNRLELMNETREVQIPVRGHDGSVTICRIAGTIEFRHLGRKIRLMNALFTAKEDEAILKVPNCKICRMRRIGGTFWVVPDDEFV